MRRAAPVAVAPAGSAGAGPRMGASAAHAGAPAARAARPRGCPPATRWRRGGACARARAEAGVQAVLSSPCEYEPLEVPTWFVFATSGAHAAVYAGAGWLLHAVGALQSWHTLVASSAVVSVLGVLVHVLGHCKFAGPWYRLHTLGHHVVVRPPRRFLSLEASAEERALEAELGMDERVAYIWLIPFASALAYTLGLESSPLGVAIAGLWTGLVLKGADYLHHHFHLMDSPLERHSWFLMLRSLHFFHHSERAFMTNFAIADFGTACARAAPVRTLPPLPCSAHLLTSPALHAGLCSPTFCPLARPPVQVSSIL